jgi:prephenate dehydrogenase
VIDSVAIIGLGLMGGSLARDLAARGVRVVGFDSNRESLQAALEEEVIADALGDDFAGIENVLAVVLAVPVKSAETILWACAPRLGKANLITDVGSVKRGIVTTAEKLGLGKHFVGSHPFTGDHRAGWSAARSNLYKGARVFLCPSAETSDGALAAAQELWSTVGALTQNMSADEHDQRIAWTSHLAQITATALAHALGQQGILSDELGPGGRSVTRLAASDADVWTDIALENGAELAAAIAELEKRLSLARAAIAAADAAAVREFFTVGATWSVRSSPS